LKRELEEKEKEVLEMKMEMETKLGLYESRLRMEVEAMNKFKADTDIKIMDMERMLLELLHHTEEAVKEKMKVHKLLSQEVEKSNLSFVQAINDLSKDSARNRKMLLEAMVEMLKE
jgi:hypothetical protein